MFNTVVWASDGSENAARALPYARALLAGEGAMLIGVHIVLEASAPGTDRAAVESGEATDLVENVKRLVSEASEQGLDVALRIANYVGAQPAQRIAEIAREVQADVIVVGTRGHSPIGALLVGSVTQALLHIAPCPVFAVPPTAELAAEVSEA
jgi:nucleotide-binding universal stress UspA family protein